MIIGHKNWNLVSCLNLFHHLPSKQALIWPPYDLLMTSSRTEPQLHAAYSRTEPPTSTMPPELSRFCPCDEDRFQKRTSIAWGIDQDSELENKHRNSVFFPPLKMVIFHSYVKLPESIIYDHLCLLPITTHFFDMQRSVESQQVV